VHYVHTIIRFLAKYADYITIDLAWSTLSVYRSKGLNGSYLSAGCSFTRELKSRKPVSRIFLRIKTIVNYSGNTLACGQLEFSIRNFKQIEIKIIKKMTLNI